MLDSPVSGAKAGAEAGTLTLMIGGDESLVKKMEPVLQAVGTNIFYLGGIGLGEVAKLANNIMVVNNTLSSTEGLFFAMKAGIPLKTILELIKLSTGNSWVIEYWSLMASVKNDRRPGSTVELMYKDLKLALEYSKTINADLPLSSHSINLDLYKLPE